MLNTIPTERLDAVKTALYTAFGVNEPEQITALTGGYSSSAIYKVLVQDKFYVLRIMGFDQNLADRQQQIECFQIAAAAGVTPQCLYADAESGIIIMDFIQQAIVNDSSSFIEHSAITLRQLHAAKPFPLLHVSIPEFIENVVRFLHKQPLSEFLADYFQRIEAVKQLLSLHLTTASCHNDLNPNNVLFGGQKTYFIDWEAAGPNDPFFDLATVCNLFDDLILEKVPEDYFLSHYFGVAPNAYQCAKLLLMKQLSYHFYAALFLEAAAMQDEPLTMPGLEPFPTLKEWTQNFIAGKYQLTTPKDFIVYALALIKTSRQQMSTAEFSHAKTLLVDTYNISG